MYYIKKTESQDFSAFLACRNNRYQWSREIFFSSLYDKTPWEGTLSRIISCLVRLISNSVGALATSSAMFRSRVNTLLLVLLITRGGKRGDFETLFQQ